MQNSFPKSSLFFSIVLLLLACSTFLFTYNQIKENNKLAQVAQVVWQTETTRREQAKTLDFSVKIIKKEREELNTHFIQSSNVVPFLDTIEKIASESGAKTEVTSVNISKDNTELALDMKAVGSFQEIYKFLALLENSPYEIEFNLIDMQSQSMDSPSDPKIKITKWTTILKIKLLSFVQ
jgi:hypothetical protein